MRFLFNFASRSRPDKLFAALDNIYQKASNEEFNVIVTLDIDDNTCNTKTIRDRLMAYPNLKPYWGFSNSKIDAINKNVCFAPEDTGCIINMSDDMFWLADNFLTEIRKDVEEHFSDTDFFLHYPDGKTKLCTMSIMGYEYYKRFGYIYHPDYKSLYCDQEAQEVAQILGKYKFINKPLFEHRHPVWGKAQWDDQYRYTEGFYAQDNQVFLARKAKNFDL